jgi:hypothetical protein
MNLKLVRGFFKTQGLLVMVALLWVILFPPKNQAAFILGFPKSTVVILSLLTVLLLLLILALLAFFKFPDRVSFWLNHIDHGLIEKHLLIPLLLVFAAGAALLILAVTLILTTPLSAPVLGDGTVFRILHTLTQRYLPLVILLILLVIGSFFFLIYLYRQVLVQRTYWSRSAVLPTLLGVLLVLATIAHWSILFLQLRVFVTNPVWYWALTNKPFTIRDIIYMLITFVLLASIVWLIFTRKNAVIPLSMVFITFLWLQFGTGFLEGDGIQDFQDRYFSTYHRAYPVKASENSFSMVENITQYETIFARSMFTSTKPPGLMAFYLSLERLVNGSPDDGTNSAETRLQRFRQFITIVFPILAALPVFLLYAFSRRFSLFETEPFAALPTLLFVMSPNIVLFSLFIDQAIYPALFLAGSWLIFRIFSHRALTLAFSLGIILYIFAFFAFTMLPLFPLAGIFLLFTWWQNPSRSALLHQVKSGLMFLLGVFSAYWLFRWILNYDFFVRFYKTVEVNNRFDFYERVGLQPVLTAEPLTVRIQQILHAALWNNLDIAAGVGIAVYLLFIIHGIRLIGRIAHRKANTADLVLGSLFGAFLTLNAAGTAQGEVARLWMFWVPMIVLLASRELVRWMKDKPYLLVSLLLAQFITLMLTYHFQDFRM